MEANQLDSNVLLPPRKRLLACLKNQNENGHCDSNSNPPSISNSTDDFSSRLNNLLSNHQIDNNHSQLEIVKASRSAADVAAKIAIAARALAEKKAIIASIAMSAAKKALELVADINEQETSSSSSKKSKRKKHVDVQMLYDLKNPDLEIEKTSDEQIARQLHHVINSSPRIPKKVTVDEKLIRVDECEEGKGIIGRKRGRMKQKKLPLSICHDRGQLSPNEEKNSLWKCQVFKTGSRLKENKAMEL